MQFHGIVAPHPLAILPHPTNQEIIQSYKDLIQKYLELTKAVGEWEPDLIINISPRGTCYLEGISIHNPPSNQYLAKLQEIDQADLAFETDKGTIHSLIKRSHEQGFPLLETDNDTLDHGALVPLFYLSKALTKTPELIALTMGHIRPEKHFELGKMLYKILADSDKKVLFIASAELSHCLTKNSPGGFNRAGKAFDKEIQEDLQEQNYERITLYDSFELDEVGEAAIRPISMMLGFLQETPHKLYSHSYCCPEGVGELLVSTFNLSQNSAPTAQ